MASWTVHQILDATGGQLVRGRPTAPVRDITIDSRRLVPGEAFVAIRGTRLNGHDFVVDAVHRGASCLVVARSPSATNGCRSIPTILVDDTTKALGDLARFHRRRCGRPVIAVTGSCGKTTTKELIAHLLGAQETILKTTGTQNNHIGVPLTLLRMTPEHRMAVVELGSNHPGEIAYLASIAEPDVAVITNVGPVHLEFFGSLTGVLREKLSLLDVIPPDGSAVLPGDQLDVCLEASRHLRPEVRRVSFGSTDRCDLQALDIQRTPQGMLLRLRDDIGQMTIPLIGYHNMENALAALSCAWAMGIPLSDAKQRLGTFEPLPLRSQVVRCRGLTILNDCYNANPLSFARALEMLRDLDAQRRIAIVGDMLELGPYAPSAHQAIGRLATQLGIDAVIAVGQYADDVAQGVREGRSDGATPPPVARSSGPIRREAADVPPRAGATGGGVTTYRTVPELIQGLPAFLHEGDGLLVKGSRKLNLEQVTEFLMTRYRGTDGAGDR